MSTAVAPTPSRFRARDLGLSAFALSIAALLLTELWLLRTRFTTDALDLRSGAWAGLVRSTRFATPFTLACVGAVAAVGGQRLRADVAALARRASLPRQLWPFALANVASLAAFHAASLALLEGPSPSPALEGPLTLAWWIAALGIPTSLVASVLPLREIGRCIANSRASLAIGAAIGTVGFAVYRITESTWPFWRPLADGTVALAYRILTLFFDDCVLDAPASVLGTPTFSVVVTKYCSGYEGVGLFLVFFTAFLAIARDRLRFPQALLLLPLGCATVWLLNAVRVAALVAIGTLISPEVAIEGFHVYAGWPLVAGVALGTVAISTRVGYFSSSARTDRHGAASNPTARYLLPLLALVATALVSGAFTDRPADLYPLRIVAAVGTLAVCAPRDTFCAGPISPAALLLGVLAWAAWIGLGASASAPWSDGATLGASSSTVRIASHWFFGALGSFVVVPIVEELAFRGYLYRRLVSPHFDAVDARRLAGVPVVVSALLFGLMHENWIAGTAAGVVYALAYVRRGRLIDAIVAHGLTNLLLALQDTLFHV